MNTKKFSFVFQHFPLQFFFISLIDKVCHIISVISRDLFFQKVQVDYHNLTLLYFNQCSM